jgi:hypothetical protein
MCDESFTQSSRMFAPPCMFLTAYGSDQVSLSKGNLDLQLACAVTLHLPIPLKLVRKRIGRVRILRQSIAQLLCKTLEDTVGSGEMQSDKASRGEVRHSSRGARVQSERMQTIVAELAARDDIDWQVHSHLTLNRMGLSRILYYDQLYRQLLGVPGVILEFGVQWGATLALLSNLRGIHEPYNFTRKLIGFDTFSGFPSIDQRDGSVPHPGDYSVPDGHINLLEEILELHEAASPVSHITKSELVVGDVCETVPRWVSENPHAIVSMAIFDLDIYAPTKTALQAILPRLTRGSILVFDELNTSEFPGETEALAEVLGLDRLRLQQFPHQPRCAWAIWE